MSIVKKKYFELWGDELAQNYILKIILLFAAGMIAILSVSVVILALRKPVLIAVGEGESKVFVYHLPSEETLRRELTRFVRKYATTRYTFTYGNIAQKVTEAKVLVSSSYQKDFDRANVE